MEAQHNLQNLVTSLESKISKEKEFDNKEEILNLIGQIKKASKACLAQAFDFFEIANHFYDALYISDGNGKTLYVNDAYVRITGIPKTEVIGKYVKSLEGQVYQDSVTQKVIETGQMQTNLGKSLINGKDLLVTGVPIFNKENELKYVVVNNRDISDLRAMQDELSAINKEFKVTKQRLNYIKEQKNALWNVFFKSPYMKVILSLLDNLAKTSFPLLIQGEIGTGKEKIASYIHNKSDRKNKEIISVLCDSKMKFSDLAEREDDQMSILELADGGTLFLKNVENLNMDFQNNLSEFLMPIDSKYQYAGKNYDIRFIFSSRADLDEKEQEGKLSLELLQQMQGLSIYIKPLRDRTEDVEYFTKVFLKVFNEKYNKSVQLGDEIIKIFYDYCWPGNVRELENMMERLVIISEDKIKLEDVENLFSTSVLDIEYQPVRDLKSMLEEYEKAIIIKAIAKYGNVNQAAKYLGISQPALWNKCKKLGIKY